MGLRETRLLRRMFSYDDCIFSETAITDCAMLRGVRYFGGGARTSTLVLRYKTGTVRFVDTINRFGDPKPAVRLW